MTMKTFYLSLIALVVCLGIKAQRISEAEALQKAQKFMKGKKLELDVRSQKARGSESRPNASEPLYLFNAEDNNGFVIVSGDKRVEEILGYSDTGKIDYDDMPDNLRSWLKGYAKEIEMLPEYQAGDTSVYAKRRTVDIHPKIEPLITTKWNQGRGNERGWIYNTLCPLTSEGKRCVTGCVPTAGAQIMYYYRYPQDMTTVVPGYTNKEHAPGVDTSEDLPPIQFNWNEMKPIYTSADIQTESERAVSELMLYCGYAAQVSYTPSGSGANSNKMAENMVNCFGYDPNTLQSVNRLDYSIHDWDELMYKELAESRPVLYSCSGGSVEQCVGHTFICDGYDGNGFFHFNWGWGGNSDGYYRLHATNPYEGTNFGFVLSQGAVIGLQPKTDANPDNPNTNDEWDEPIIEGITIEVSKVSIEGNVVNMNFANRNEETYGFAVGFGEVNDDGTLFVTDTKFDNNQMQNLRPNYGFRSSFDFSTYQLSQGTHKFVPVCKVRGEDSWKQCEPVYLWFEVIVDAQETITIIQHPVVDLKVNSIKPATGCQPNLRQTLSVNITNLSSENYHGKINLYEGTDINSSKCVSSKEVKIKSGNTKEYRMTIYSEFPEGTYVYSLYEESTSRLIGFTTMDIAQILKATHIEVRGNKCVNYIQEVNPTIECRESERSTPIYLFASLDDKKGSYIYAVGASIEKDCSEDFTFFFLPKDAGLWNLWICSDNEGECVIGQTSVTIDTTPSAIIQPMTDSIYETYYMLDGRRLTTTPNQKGIYIVNGRKVIY